MERRRSTGRQATLYVSNDNGFVPAIADTHHRSGIDNPNTIHVFAFDDEGHLQGWRSSRSSLPATASGCRKTLGQRSAMTMSKSTAISSFTFTVPPAMLMGVIANSLCRSVVEPL